MRAVDRPTLLLAALLSAGMALSACSAGDRPATTSAGAPAKTTSAQAQALPAPTGPPCSPDQYKVDGEPGKKPTITVPAGCAPQDGLLVKDLTVGTGAEVKQGSSVEVQYVLATFRDRKTREASWDDKPYTVRNVGQASVVQGWNEGLIGLKEGGRRLLVVPPDKGYPEGNGAIQPGETLVFVIDALKVG
ncbi:FKBP-type peptidyl-prolyl cis-trans isomerase [Actinosynnema sp. NPDC020468]|uniref:FKBP-type peptidyl-prolyl cis-trans isomerase n=1 Tax=Actinosynnema sp. NPDC020468 TaxID=3154488 RepID=UPI0033CDFD6C